MYKTSLKTRHRYNLRSPRVAGNREGIILLACSPGPSPVHRLFIRLPSPWMDLEISHLHLQLASHLDMFGLNSWLIVIWIHLACELWGLILGHTYPVKDLSFEWSRLRSGTWHTSDRRKFMLARPFPRVNLQALRRSNFHVHSVWQAWDGQYSP